MRVIISDSSCLIDLHKGRLLEELFNLPFTFAIPQPLFEEELLSISSKEKMLTLGLEVLVVPGTQVLAAQTYFNENRRLKLNDCFALAMAESINESILFTGDNPLRMLAEIKEIETHGVLWATDMLETHTNIDLNRILDALLQYEKDPLVFLPKEELKQRIRKLRRILSE